MKKHLLFLAAALCCTMTAAASGLFSIAANKQVEFASGNLQYHTGDEVWRFAPNQYDAIGEANINIGDPDFSDWIDMFAWSTTSTYYGVSPSNNNNDYTGDFVDWGELFPGEGWFTMSRAEWDYLLKTRTGAADKWASAYIDGVFGIILLPDSWTLPEGVDFVPRALPEDEEEDAEVTPIVMNDNNYSLEQWDLLDAAGAVFLPAAGRRTGGYGNVINYSQQVETNPALLPGGYYRWHDNLNYCCYYWTCTMYNTTTRTIFYMINLREVNAAAQEFAYRGLEAWTERGRYGQSVRLVRESQGPSTAIEETKQADSAAARMLLEDGKIFILRNGEKYTLNGQKVK